MATLIKISQLPVIASCQLTDIIAEVQPASGGTTYQATLQQLATLFNANLTFLPLAGGTMSGNIAMGSNSITGLANPVNPQDAATKTYVDNVASGGGAPCVCATTANLTATYNNGSSGVGATLTNSGSQATFSLDGQTPSVGARVLIKNQSTNTQNGVYTVTNAGSISTNWVLTRATDYNTPSNINNTSIIPIENGTVNANTAWINTTLMVTVGTTAVTFVQFGTTYPISLANGGTNNSLTASAGGIVWSDSTKLNILSGTSTAGQLLLSGNAAPPSWSTSTYPSTNAINTLLYASSANTMAALATANSSVLVTNVSGVPSLSTTLPSGLSATNLSLTTPALGTPSSGTLTNCTGLPVSTGISGLGTGVATALAAGVTGSGNIALSTSPTFVTPVLGAASATSLSFSSTSGIIGTTTNNNAAAGSVGEYIFSSLAVGSAVGLTSGTPANVTSISLRAGDWDVWGTVYFSGNAASTIGYLSGSISQTSATFDLTNGSNVTISGGNATVFSLVTNESLTINQIRVPLGSTTTLYLVAQSMFAVSTVSAYGIIQARCRR